MRVGRWVSNDNLVRALDTAYPLAPALRGEGQGEGIFVHVGRWASNDSLVRALDTAYPLAPAFWS